MGRKARLLKEEQNEYYNNEANDHLVDPEQDEKLRIQEQEIYDFDTAFLLQQELIKYTVENAWPLCEYLDLVNTKNFVMYLLRH